MYILREKSNKERDFELLTRREPVMTCHVCGSKWDSVAKRMNFYNGFVYAFRNSFTGTSYQNFISVVSEEMSNFDEGKTPIWFEHPGWEIRYLTVKRMHFSNLDFMVPSVGIAIISSRLADILHEAELTGFFVEPISIQGTGISRDYLELCITGNCGKAISEPRISMEFSCDLCGKKKFSIVENECKVDEKQWDGSDFSRFMGAFGGYMIVSGKVKEIMTRENLSGFGFSDISVE